MTFPKAMSLSPAVCSFSILFSDTGIHVAAGETDEGVDLSEKWLRGKKKRV